MLCFLSGTWSHCVFFPRILLSSSTVLRFSIQIASIGPSPDVGRVHVGQVMNGTTVRMNCYKQVKCQANDPSAVFQCTVVLLLPNGCKPQLKRTQGSGMDTVKNVKTKHKTSKVSAHRESIHHLNSHDI